MKTEEIKYNDGETTLKGFIAIPDKAEKSPGVLVAHAWGGRDQFSCDKAVALAEMGFVGLALDMYGDAKQGNSVEENTALMTPFMEQRDLVARRMSLALTALKEHPAVDAEKTAAMGYCFGGLCALDLARSGADVLGVCSFHGLLQGPGNTKNISAKVLALHGYDDPMAKPEALLEFAKEMDNGGADWQAHLFGGTMHAFTNPAANDPDFGTVYSKSADTRSWELLKGFLAELF